MKKLQLLLAKIDYEINSVVINSTKLKYLLVLKQNTSSKCTNT